MMHELKLNDNLFNLIKQGSKIIDLNNYYKKFNAKYMTNLKNDECYIILIYKNMIY